MGELIVPDNPTDASCLCARVKGRGMSIKGEPCNRRYPGSVLTNLSNLYESIKVREVGSKVHVYAETGVKIRFLLEPVGPLG